MDRASWIYIENIPAVEEWQTPSSMWLMMQGRRVDSHPERPADWLIMSSCLASLDYNTVSSFPFHECACVYLLFASFLSWHYFIMCNPPSCCVCIIFIPFCLCCVCMCACMVSVDEITIFISLIWCGYARGACTEHAHNRSKSAGLGGL